MFEIFSKSTIKTPERCHCFGVFIVDFEQVNADWGGIFATLSNIYDRRF